MLSRFFSIAAATALTSGGIAAVASGASAAVPSCLPDACATSVVTLPGGGGTGGSGGTGGGGGNTGPGLGCPTVGGQVVCAPGANAPAAVQRVPTIELVYQARDRLAPGLPHIHITPSPRSYVDIRTALSLDPGDVGNLTAQATTPGQTVTVTAFDVSVTWDTGEGTETCGNADCGHTYQYSSAHHGGPYAIYATVTWQKIRWTCEGDCDAGTGVLDYPVHSPAAQDALTVGEVQTESNGN